MAKIMQIAKRFMADGAHAQLSWPGLLTRLFLAPANEADGEMVPALLEGTSGVVLGDRN
jgi:hypothetical protein